MRILSLTLLSAIFLSCSNNNEEKTENQNKSGIKAENSFHISAIDAKFPLRLGESDFNSDNKIIQLNDGIVSRIEEVVKAYANDLEFSDSSQTYRDSYINTIQLHDSLTTIYLILLKHFPTNEINSKVLFYSNQKKQFADSSFGFNLYALYNIDDGKLKSSNLKSELKITSPEIELIDFNKDGVNDFKFTRLFHNGTFNAIRTTILTIKNLKVDTLYFKEKIIRIKQE